MQLRFFLALQSLLYHRTSFLLMLVATTAGVSLQIPNSALINGHQAELMRQGVTRASGHVMVQPRSGEKWQGVAEKAALVRSQPFVRAVAIRLIQGGAVARGDHFSPARVVGIEPQNEEKSAGFCGRISRGACFDGNTQDSVVLGALLAEELKVKLGKKINVVVPHVHLGEVEISQARLRVVGILKGTGGFITDYDAFVSLPKLLSLMPPNTEPNRLAVFVTDYARSEEYARRIEPLVGPAKVQAWFEIDEFVANTIAASRVVFMVSMAMVAIAVAIPILALLYVHVLRDRRQIAIMAALGFSRTDLFWIYAQKAIIVGGLGALFGTCLGLLLCGYFQYWPLFEYSGFVIRPHLTPLVLWLPPVFLFTITLVAGIWPALMASRANPSLQLREG